MSRINSRSVIYIAHNTLNVGHTSAVNLVQYINNFAFQVSLVGDGLLSALVNIEFSNDGVTWVSDPISRLKLAGLNSIGAGFTNKGNWNYARGSILNITGNNALVTITVGVIK